MSAGGIVLGIIYVSEAQLELTASDIQELVALSQESNRQNGITGYIWFHSPHFLQYFEGDCDAVGALLTKIEADPRHRVIIRFEDAHLAHRRFPNWHMKKIVDSVLMPIDPQFFLKEQMLFLTSVPYDSFGLSDNIWRLVENLSKTAQKYNVRER